MINKEHNKNNFLQEQHPELVFPQYQFDLSHLAARFAGAQFTPVTLKTQAEVKKMTHEEGNVPVLRTSEGNITGASSIARYFALSSKPELLGNTEIEQTLVDEYMNLIDLEVLPNSRAILYFLTGRIPCETTHKMTVVVNELKKSLEHYNQVLEGKQFLLGESVSLADLQLATYIMYPLCFAVNAQWRNKVLNLMNWFYRVTDLDGHFQQIFGKIKMSTTVLQPPKPKKPEPKKKEEKKEKKQKKEEKKEEFPPTKINIDDFKRFVINSKDPEEIAKWLKEEFETEGWSIYHLIYDIYKDEGTQLHITGNLCSGFVERAEACRRSSFGVHCVLGEEPNLGIEGIWMWRGLEVSKQMKDHPTFEYYEAKKLDTKNEEHAKLILDFWMKREGDQISGKTIQRRTHM